jgi:hypothetical protein
MHLAACLLLADFDPSSVLLNAKSRLFLDSLLSSLITSNFGSVPIARSLATYGIMKERYPNTPDSLSIRFPSSFKKLASLFQVTKILISY